MYRCLELALLAMTIDQTKHFAVLIMNMLQVTQNLLLVFSNLLFIFKTFKVFSYFVSTELRLMDRSYRTPVIKLLS